MLDIEIFKSLNDLYTYNFKTKNHISKSSYTLVLLHKISANNKHKNPTKIINNAVVMFQKIIKDNKSILR